MSRSREDSLTDDETLNTDKEKITGTLIRISIQTTWISYTKELLFIELRTQSKEKAN